MGDGLGLRQNLKVLSSSKICWMPHECWYLAIGRKSDSEAEDFAHAEKLLQVRAVLEEKGHFSGIYRKVQLKPLKWVKVTISNDEGKEE